MNPRHDTRGTLISHYVDEHKRSGESTCICGMPIHQKIESHVLRAPTRPTFNELVRLCPHWSQVEISGL